MHTRQTKQQQNKQIELSTHTSLQHQKQTPTEAAAKLPYDIQVLWHTISGPFVHPLASQGIPSNRN